MVCSMVTGEKGKGSTGAGSQESSPWLSKPVNEIPVGSISNLREEAKDCRRCPLWRYATQTVFGAGRVSAKLMLIGEQPGDKEDLAGKPFVGPAGHVLHEALEAAGIAPSEVYLTNTVKHFKFESRGKVRLHKRANASEQEACRPWLAAELARVSPSIVVALGAMAAQTLFGNSFRVSTQRGNWQLLPNGREAIATWHPSAILRMPGDERIRALAELTADLRKAVARLGSIERLPNKTP
jgi:uracil-DNA glycosylase